MRTAFCKIYGNLSWIILGISWT